MAGRRSVLAIFKAVALASWRDVQSFKSIAGQNFVLFLLFVALQPESAEFFAVILALILLLTLSANPLQKIPAERRLMWPVSNWQWALIRAGALLLSPIALAAVYLLLNSGWQMTAFFLCIAVPLQAVSLIGKRIVGRAPQTNWLFWIPAPPGFTGAIMRLHWREMFTTLDTYIALLLMLCTEAYQLSGKPLDPAAPRILAMVVALALSTQTQVLLGMDGPGAERYRRMPIRGWQLLLAKDLAYLLVLAILVTPLDIISGFMAGLAALTIGHHRSVTSPIAQLRWRFSSGALFPDGAIQTIVLFAVGNASSTLGMRMIAPCMLAWIGSVIFFGRKLDVLACAS